METATALPMLSALAHEVRLTAFRHLVAAGRDGLAAGVLADRLAVPPSTLSFHLKDLSAAGLVTARRDGRSIVYSADVGAVEALAGFLLDDCCNGRPEACGIVPRRIKGNCDDNDGCT